MPNKILEFFKNEEFNDRWGSFKRDGDLFITGDLLVKHVHYFMYIPEKDVMLGCTPVHLNAYRFYTPKTPDIKNIYLRKYAQLPVGKINQTIMQTIASSRLIKYIPKDSNPLGEEWLMGGMVLNTKEGTCYVPSSKEYSFRICLWPQNSSST
jgi:hypothetical protein